MTARSSQVKLSGDPSSGSPSSPTSHRGVGASRSAVRRGLAAGALAALAVLWACLSPPINLSTSRSDGGSDGSSGSTDGNSALIGQFTIDGCADLSFPAGEVRCVGTAPLRVTLVLIQLGATTYRWKLVAQGGPVDGGASGDAGAVGDGGAGDVSLLDDAASRSPSPSVILKTPGTYQVTLGVAGPGGTATAAGTILVRPAPLGAACTQDGQCEAGLRCLCGQDTPGRDGTCPGGLQAGICTRSCDGRVCPTGSLCLDLSRTSSTGLDGGTGDAWRQPICIPACAGGQQCRADLTCRELPALPAGGRAGDPYTFGAGCFVTVPAGVGESCSNPSGLLDANLCATGVCEPLGLRNLCTAPCGGCPTSAACAAWNSATAPAPSGPRCLQRCSAMTPCGDPLLACVMGGGAGALGFSLPGEPTATTVCAPRSCSGPADCPGGRCAALAGGSFCLHN